MNKFIFIFLLSTSLYGQRLIRNPYEEKMVSTAIEHFRTTIGVSPKKNEMMTLRASKYVKITIKSSINIGAVNKVINAELDGMADGLAGDEFTSFGKYDIRTKIYTSKRTRILLRLFANTPQTTGMNKGYNYTGGFVFKF